MGPGTVEAKREVSAGDQMGNHSPGWMSSALVSSRCSNHAVSVHGGGTESWSFADGLLIRIIKDSLGLFRAAPLRFDHLFTYTAPCIMYPRPGLSNLPRRLRSWTAAG